MTLSIPRWWFGGDAGEDEHRRHRQGEDRDTEASRTAPITDPDAELLARIRGPGIAEAQAAFEHVFRAYYEMLTGVAYTILRSSDAARDVVAEVFTTVWFIRREWIPAVSARAYLIAAVRRRALNVTRNERRHEASLREKADAPVHPETALIHGIDDERQLAQVYAAIAGMRGIRRDVMTLRWRHALSIPEIASALGISTNTVSAHLSQALRALKEALGRRQAP